MRVGTGKRDGALTLRINTGCKRAKRHLTSQTGQESGNGAFSQRTSHLLFLYDVISAMRQAAAASHFGRVCAGSITCRAPLYPFRRCRSCEPINAFLTLTDVTKW